MKITPIRCIYKSELFDYKYKDKKPESNNKSSYKNHLSFKAMLNKEMQRA